MVFGNPSRNLTDVWIQPELEEEVSAAYSLFRDKKYSAENVADIIDQMDPGEVEHSDHLWDIAERGVPNVDSITRGPEIEDRIEESEIESLEWGIVEEEDGSHSAASGPIHVETRSANGEVRYSLWVPYVNEADGLVAGKIKPPHAEPETFKKSYDEDIDTGAWIEDDVIDTVYQLAREQVPEAVPDYTGDFGPDWFKRRLVNSDLGRLVTKLEKDREVQIGRDEHVGSRRGNDVAEELVEFVNRAKERRLIDYSAEINYGESRVEISHGGYKTFFGDLGDAHNTMDELIEYRVTQ